MHIKIRPRRCLGGRCPDCQRCGKPLITRAEPFRADVGLAPIKAEPVQSWNYVIRGDLRGSASVASRVAD
jgi:hypothetical protein